jgi:hypothetical protein
VILALLAGVPYEVPLPGWLELPDMPMTARYASATNPVAPGIASVIAASAVK